MEAKQDPSREQHHSLGHNAIIRLNNQGVIAIEEGIRNLQDLVDYVVEGSAHEKGKVELNNSPDAPTPPLAEYLVNHSTRINVVNQALMDLGIKISENVSKLKSILY